MKSEAGPNTPLAAICKYCKKPLREHAGEVDKCLFEPTYFSPKDPKHGRTVALLNVQTKTLLSWLAKARQHRCGGSYLPPGWKREFTIANLTAELSQRADRYDYGKPARKKARQEQAKAKRNR